MLSPSAFNEAWVSVHIMETETEKPSGSLLQKQLLSPEMGSQELPGVEPISINEEEFRQEFWQGLMEEREKEKECFDSPSSLRTESFNSKQPSSPARAVESDTSLVSL
jgi:hypothetical protein